MRQYNAFDSPHNCACLCAGLRLLKVFDLDASCCDQWIPPWPRDVSLLTALTGLTKLRAIQVPEMDDVAVAGISSWLKQLKHLELSYCELTSAAVLPMIGTLTCLTQLGIMADEYGPVDHFPDAAIMWLTTLTGLKYLNIGSFFNKTAQIDFGQLSMLQELASRCR